jgi:hypothetical protein
MGAVSFGSLLGGIAAKATAQPVGIWRSTYDVTDLRAQVGRRFGDGSVNQSLDVIEAIKKTAMAWAKENRPQDRSWQFMLNSIHTPATPLRGFMDFKKRHLRAAHEMIVGNRLCARHGPSPYYRLARYGLAGLGPPVGQGRGWIEPPHRQRLFFESAACPARRKSACAS